MAALYANLQRMVGTEVLGLLGFLLAVIVAFSLTAPQFQTAANFQSMAFQMPVLGLLTLAMLIPIVSGGFNLAIIYTANLSGLTLAYVLNTHGGVDAGIGAFVVGSLAALCVGALSGCIIGLVIAYIGAHPILVSLAMMIFLRGLGEFLTNGGDISGFPTFMAPIGQGALLGIPVPLYIFAVAAVLWHFLLSRTRHGLAARMIGSNIRATAWAARASLLSKYWYRVGLDRPASTASSSMLRLA